LQLHRKRRACELSGSTSTPTDGAHQSPERIQNEHLGFTPIKNEQCARRRGPDAADVRQEVLSVTVRFRYVANNPG
jgi:hypothetical protein